MRLPGQVQHDPPSCGAANRTAQPAVRITAIALASTGTTSATIYTRTPRTAHLPAVGFKAGIG
jgi:hypothetical protein